MFISFKKKSEEKENRERKWKEENLNFFVQIFYILAHNLLLIFSGLLKPYPCLVPTCIY